MERPRVLVIDDAEYLSLLYKEELLGEGYAPIRYLMPAS